MDICPGEIVALIGENGAGKTTTFRMIMNLISPSSGSISFNNKKIDEIDTSSPEMILYVDKLINAWGGEDLEACIKESTKILGYTDYEKIAEDNDSMTFCLSK